MASCMNECVGKLLGVDPDSFPDYYFLSKEGKIRDDEFLKKWRDEINNRGLEFIVHPRYPNIIESNSGSFKGIMIAPHIKQTKQARISSVRTSCGQYHVVITNGNTILFDPSSAPYLIESFLYDIFIYPVGKGV